MHARMLRPSAPVLLAVALLAAAAPGAPAQAQAPQEGDAAAGRIVFNRQCAVCHSTEAGQNKIGPTLAGVFGRPAAQVADYAYSPAMREANRSWDAATLDGYLANPRTSLPGGRMIFVGLRDPKQRADVIAYLATLR